MQQSSDNVPVAICVLCKETKELPCIQDMYETDKGYPAITRIVRVRCCQQCKDEMQAEVDRLNPTPVTIR